MTKHIHERCRKVHKKYLIIIHCKAAGILEVTQMGWIKLLLIGQVDININGNNRLILLFRSVVVKTVAFACVLKTPDRSIISPSGHRRANSSFLTSRLVSAHSCTTECPYTPPNTLSVRIHVISSQLSQ